MSAERAWQRLDELWATYDGCPPEEWPEEARAEREALLEATYEDASRRARRERARKARRLARGLPWVEPEPQPPAEGCPCPNCRQTVE